MSSSLELVTSSLPAALVHQFRSLLEKMSRFAEAEKIDLKPYESPELFHFNKLPEPLAKQITLALTEYVDTLGSIRDQSENLSYNLNSVWLHMRKLGLRFPNDFFETLEPSDIVEIYEMGGLQIFRSFHFFKYVSYDFESLLCMRWYELFQRDEEHEMAYMSQFGRLLAGQVKGVEPVATGPHVVTERRGHQRRNFALPRFFAMLNDPQGRPTAWAHVLRIDDLQN